MKETELNIVVEIRNTLAARGLRQLADEIEHGDLDVLTADEWISENGDTARREIGGALGIDMPMPCKKVSIFLAATKEQWGQRKDTLPIFQGPPDLSAIGQYQALRKEHNAKEEEGRVADGR